MIWLVMMMLLSAGIEGMISVSGTSSPHAEGGIESYFGAFYN